MSPSPASLRRLAAPTLAVASALIVLAIVALATPRPAAQGPSAGSQAPSAGEIARPFTVFVTVPPQAWLVERIAGDRARVEVLVPPGQSPHTYNPTPRLVGDMARARLFFSIGLPMEQQILARSSSAFPNLQVVNTLRGVTLRRFQAHEEHRHDEAEPSDDGHDHGHAHDHSDCGGQCGQDGFDPHVWLDPMILKRQAETIRDGLIAIDPDGRRLYDERCGATQKDLDRLHEELTRRLAPYRGRDLFVFHPAFGYFADAYGLRQMPIEIEGKSPAPRQLVEFIRTARQQRAKVIFVQPQFDAQSAEAVAKSIGGQVAPLDPLARDVAGNLRAIADAIVAAYGDSEASQP